MLAPATDVSAPKAEGPVPPADLARARLRIAWQMLAQVGEHADLLPLATRAHVAQALAALVQAKAIVEESTAEPATLPTGGHDSISHWKTPMQGYAPMELVYATVYLHLETQWPALAQSANARQERLSHAREQDAPRFRPPTDQDTKI